MAKVKLFCDYCGFETYKEQKEITRKFKNNPNAKFYCSNMCSGFAQDKNLKIEEKECPLCKTKFKCNTANKKTNRTFCSRGCASAGSVTEARRETGRKIGVLNHTPDQAALLLRSREWWKYEEIKRELISRKLNHQFEYVIEKSIYDLALIDMKILIEFDGPYHQWLNDELKNKLAESYGWKLVRIQTLANQEIPFTKIEYLLPSGV
jgi:very-short-patch-repair endonuclease